MTPEAKQALIGSAILALGFAFRVEVAMIAGLALDVGAAMRAFGGVILADYALDRILRAWRSKPQ